MRQKDVEKRQREAKIHPPEEFTCQICHTTMKNIHMGKFHWVCDMCESKADEGEADE